jgi:hypothetical protein
MQRLGLTCALLVAALTATSSRARALEAASESELFPGAGRVSLSAATGVPYVAIAEAAVGVSEGFTIGALGGLTPWVEAVGLRPRVGLQLDRETRVFVVAPMFYYPKTNGLGNEPWVLAYPSARLERRVQSIHLHAGLGLIAAACADALLAELGGEEEHAEGHGLGEPELGFMGGVWNTVIVGASLSLGGGHVLFADAALVMSGVVPAGRDWIGGPPCVFTLGTAWNL